MLNSFLSKRRSFLKNCAGLWQPWWGAATGGERFWGWKVGSCWLGTCGWWWPILSIVFSMAGHSTAKQNSFGWGVFDGIVPSNSGKDELAGERRPTQAAVSIFYWLLTSNAALWSAKICQNVDSKTEFQVKQRILNRFQPAIEMIRLVVVCLATLSYYCSDTKHHFGILKKFCVRRFR